MSKHNHSPALDVYGVQSRTSNASSPLVEYHSRVGEFRNIRTELRTLQAYQGRPQSQDAGMSGDSIASRLRETADRLVQKEKEMEILKARCQETGVYQEPSDSDSDCIDSLSELGPGHMANAPSTALRSRISTAVPSLHENYSYATDRQYNSFYNRQGVSSAQMEDNHVIIDSWPHSAGMFCATRPSYTGNPGWHGSRNAMRQNLSDDSASEYEQEILRPYQHKKFPATGFHIRLVRLMAAVPSRREIDCEIVHGDLDGPNLSPFEALSYVWGEPSRNATIRIRQGGVLYSFRVSQNLFSALQRLRQRRHDRMLWVDAICINQVDLEERSHQIRRMGDIYRMASRVCIWLGEADEDSDMAMDFIQRNVLLKSVHELCRSQDANYGWAALASFMQRPWFSRRWVIQEVSLSNEARLHCGARSMAWPDFADAVSIFVEAEAATRRYQEVMGRDLRTSNLSFGEVSMLGASRLVDITSNLLRTSAGKRVPLMSLEHLVSQLSAFDVAEPHDAIYSLLGLAKDINLNRASGGGYGGGQTFTTRSHIDTWAARYLNAKACQVDYSLPFVELCKDFVVFSIAQSASVDSSGALDIICRHWAPNNWKADRLVYQKGYGRGLAFDRDSLPSWVPDLTGAAYSNLNQMSSKLGIGRKNGDSLVGLPGTSPRNYSAAGTRGVDLDTLRFKKHDKSYIMLVSGFVLDEVSTVEVASQGGHIPEEWIRAATWNNTDSNQHEDFWRTLVANRGSSGRNPPIYYKRVCREFIMKGIASGSLNTTKLIKEGGVSIISDYFKRVQSVIWNKSLMRTKSDRLGIVSKRAQKGDLICILYGCSVPVILRRHLKSEEMAASEKKGSEPDTAERQEAVVIQLQRAFRRRRNRRLAMDLIAESTGSDKSTTSPQKVLDWQLDMQKSKLYSPGSPLSRKADEKYWYTLIGECYVHGMMDGEAISYQHEQGIMSQIFELR